MKNETKLLLKKGDEIETLNFNTKEEAKHYAHELEKEMREQEQKLMEEKRKLDDLIWELRHKESKVFDYYLNIK